MEKLLLVDDDIGLLETLQMHFEEKAVAGQPRFEVRTAMTGAGALRSAAELRPDLILLDMMLPDRSGLGLISELQRICPHAPVVVITAHHDTEATIRAMKAGAFDFVHKPFREEADLDTVVERALELRRVTLGAPAMEMGQAEAPLHELVGESPRMQQLIKEIGKVSASQATVLISGESGTGKELVARVVHAYSSEEPRPFVGINCSAIVDTLLESELFGHEKGAFTGAISAKQGKFELAADGSVFLDEVGDMSLGLQAKLLRVLQEREFERVGGIRRQKLRARVIAATHRNLAEEVTKERFREDLYQRLKVVTLEVPPLRERRSDIPVLVKHLLVKINHKVNKQVTRVPPDVLQHLSSLPWPGNVRELENVLTRAVVLAPGDLLMREYLPTNPALTPPDFSQQAVLASLAEMERMHILRALEATRGHKGKACQILGISRPTLERKLKKYGFQGSR